MFRRTQFFFFACAVIVFAFSAVAFAQNAPISGTVSLKKADGTVTPLEGATVEAFRTDIKASGPTVTTDKRGAFTFIGLQPGGTYVLSISAPGATPQFLPNIKPGTERLKFDLEPGDGRRLTPDEVREGAALAVSGGHLTEDQKKAQAEHAAKVKEVTEKNAKIEAETKIIEASLKGGNEAFGAKNWDMAVAKYDEGIAANPTFAGSAPVLMNNRGIALRQRAVENYNKHVKNPDATAKLTAMNSVKEDLAESADSFSKALAILKSASATDIPDSKVKQDHIKNSLSGASETFRIMARVEQVDETKLEIAKSMIPAAAELESDNVKKSEAFTVLGDLYRVVRDFDNAVSDYRKAVDLNKNNADALAGLGLSLFESGVVDKAEGDEAKDKARSDRGTVRMQEGLNYLTAFTEVAADSHPLKASVKDATTYLTNEAKLAPQKVTPPRRRNN